MTTCPHNPILQTPYAAALQSFLAEDAEPALEQAYELGRRAIAEGVDLLDFAARHQEALAALVARAAGADEIAVLQARAAIFFLESLAPFAMTHRGYREANATLARTNAALQQEIAERRRAEEQIRAINQSLEQRVAERTAELTQASRLKDEFLALLSHELRTPLTPIHGWVHILRTQPLEGPKLEQALSAIERNLKAELQIVNDLLDVSAIIKGKLLLKMRPVDPVPVLTAALEVMQPAADARNLHLKVTVEPVGGILRADPERLQQVFWNLLSNAMKFTPAAGCVAIRLRRTNSHIEFAVQDSGIGIAPEFLPYAFDRFRQADSSSTRRYGGLGLGLAIVRHIVELHGGSAEVTSEGPGKGTTVTVRLPIHEAAAETPPAAPPTTHAELAPAAAPLPRGTARPRLRILIVDDEADTRTVLRALLTQFGMEVHTAGSAAEALAALPLVKPDVLLADIGMPEQDGYSLIRKVRSLPPDCGGTVPAIALTAFAMEDDRRTALAAGFQAHVGKPVNPPQLVETIEALAAATRIDAD
jgi:signal transduction histidine kinase/ActR/RegA family two-component response regulator